MTVYESLNPRSHWRRTGLYSGLLVWTVYLAVTMSRWEDPLDWIFPAGVLAILIPVLLAKILDTVLGPFTLTRKGSRDPDPTGEPDIVPANPAPQRTSKELAMIAWVILPLPLIYAFGLFLGLLGFIAVFVYNFTNTYRLVFLSLLAFALLYYLVFIHLLRIPPVNGILF